jgi:hypothetical protein
MAITRFATKEEAEATGGQITWVFDADGNNWEVRTDSDTYEDLRPTVTKWQFVQACVNAGITEAQLDAAVALMTPKRKRFWAYTGKLDRDNPFSSGLRTNLTPSPTPKEWSAIFLAASELDPLKV